MNDALLSSKNMCWCTPPDFFAELDREFHFELDPASTDKSAKCAKHFTPDDDGHVLWFSQWDYDNRESWHLYGWEDSEDEAVMQTVFQTETEAGSSASRWTRT